MNITRRHLLRTTALVPVGLALASCSALTGAVSSLPQYVADANLVASGLAALLPSLTTITGMTAGTITKVQGWITQAQNLASLLSDAAKAGGGNVMTIVTNFAGVVGEIGAALGVSLPSGVSSIISAIASLMPVILSAAGVVLAGPAPVMSAAQARAILTASVR